MNEEAPQSHSMTHTLIFGDRFGTRQYISSDLLVVFLRLIMWEVTSPLAGISAKVDWHELSFDPGPHCGSL